MASLPAITARLENMDAVLLGPGLGRSEELTRLVQAVLLRCRAPLVLDADGINAVAGHIDVLRGCACPVVLTRMTGNFCGWAATRRRMTGPGRRCALHRGATLSCCSRAAGR